MFDYLPTDARDETLQAARRLFFEHGHELVGAASGFADDVVVMTELDVDPIELHNAAFLDSLKETDPEADAAVRRATRGSLGARAISDIVRDVGLPGRGFRAVGRLLRRGELALAKRERITPESLVCRATG
ncbi:hypothetical protein [Palleronia salina]|uniref:hypothetical protein n=1 Tax=Palleronia salina TaxID=313368 RepID=UPI00093308F2|nr:hypothetical protein [Palleronia salina]